MRKLLPIIAPVLIVGLGFGVMAILHLTKPKPEERNEPPRPLALFVEEVKSETLRLDVYSEGEVSARTEIDLISQVGGRILSVSEQFNNGGQFAADEVLIQIEDTDYQIAEINARAEVARWQTILLQAEADAEVARQQLRGLSSSDLGLKKPQITEAQAGLLAAEANLQQAQLNLERTRISLPFNSRIREKYVDLGQFVSPGTPIARVFSTDFAEINLPLSDNQLAGLGLPLGFNATEEDYVAVELSALVAGRQRSWQGQLVRISSAFDPSTRLLFAVAEVSDPYGVGADSSAAMPLAVGLYVTAKISGKEFISAQVIPRDALRSDDKVYVVSDGLLNIRDVQVESSDDERAVLTEGVEEGELVIVSPVRNPEEGLAVEPLFRDSSDSLSDSDDAVNSEQGNSGS